MTEDELLTAILDAAMWRQWRTHHIRRSDRAIQQGHAGFPDIIAVRGARLVVAELKSARGRVEEAQTAWLDTFRRTGAECFVWRPADLDDALEVLR